MEFKPNSINFVSASDGNFGFVSNNTSPLIDDGKKVNAAAYSQQWEYFMIGGDQGLVHLFEGTTHN